MYVTTGVSEKNVPGLSSGFETSSFSSEFCGRIGKGIFADDEAMDRPAEYFAVPPHVLGPRQCDYVVAHLLDVSRLTRPDELFEQAREELRHIYVVTIQEMLEPSSEPWYVHLAVTVNVEGRLFETGTYVVTHNSARKLAWEMSPS